MATTESIRESFDALNDFVIEAKSLVDTFRDLTGDRAGTPSWPLVMHAQVCRIEQAAERLERLLWQVPALVLDQPGQTP